MIGWRVTVNADLAVARVRAGAVDGLNKAAEHVLHVSNTHVPLEEGTLMRSGQVTSPTTDSLEAAVSYATPYAVRQHEELSYRHANGRTAKYLENALRSESQTAANLIATAVRRALG